MGLVFSSILQVCYCGGREDKHSEFSSLYKDIESDESVYFNTNYTELGARLPPPWR